MGADGELLRYQDPEELLESHEPCSCNWSDDPRDLLCRESASGIHLAMDFLTRNTKSLWIRTCKTGNFLMQRKACGGIGGGDTGRTVSVLLAPGCKSF
ncbi:MAG: hypothetical protein CM1200mP41_32340 [Gammaproteobacteria bacterium]|nr:MAG: hypothetical protein CM1200mP41_32340 [Gammaproteobacteria bacterium]